MKLSTRLVALFTIAALFLVAACSRTGYDTPPRILVFSKTMGYRHASIPTGIAALRTLCSSNGMLVDTTEDAEAFNEKNLKRYAAVVFLSTTGDVLNTVQENAFERYIQAGGGFVGVHAATDTEYGWSWFTGLVGGQFDSHPEIQEADLKIKDHNHLSTKHLKGDTWRRKDEWYNFKNLNNKVNVLLTIDEKSYKGGKNGDNHPMCWYHDYDGGRAWYTAGGHTDESYSEPDFLKHLLGGIKYAVGKNKHLAYNNCRTPEVPDPTRFTKTVLASDLTEPMEFDMLPDGKVIIIERRGAIKLFDPESGLLTVVHKMNVHSEFEDGLMGCALDPKYEKNHWIYLYYSPIGMSSNRLSRFVFEGDSLNTASEKIILHVDTQRDECCHAGGSVEFDAEGNLFLSTGDNTNPFASEGYAPIDERKGRSPWDAQKSSGNTNDLRGKILRIKPNEDGTYSCPAGNLFNGDSGIAGRPEIYVMGCRNPFRISLDNRRKFLFWGEVGPDAGEPDTTRGPQGHDEVNRAKSSGFFGWPYFVGNNKPYFDRDFTSSKRGERFDPLRPVNNSPNNTGSQILPPAQPAFIWYPYANSPEFPLVKNGGRNAMAGPVYYCDQYPEATRFPEYFDGKLIIYDWMRNWMRAITIDSLGNFGKMEPFGDSIQLSRPMDMFVDKKGSLWVLEYGTQWFSSNPDARLSRIDYYRGNRPPLPHLQVDKMAGAAPCTVRFDCSATRDYDKDNMHFEIDFGDGTSTSFYTKAFKKQSPIALAESNLSGTSTQPTVPANPEKYGIFEHVYTQIGNYEVKLKVTDPSGAFNKTVQKIAVGNEPPTIAWDLGGHNRSFYKPGTTLNYQIQLSDQEDGSLASGAIQPSSVSATIDYLVEGFDMTLIAQGHQTAAQNTEYARGKILLDRSDCKTCHAIERKVNGPSYQSIAERYRGDAFAVRNLSKKVITGGNGVWGETVMSAHPQLSEADAGEMVRWILSLGNPTKADQSIAISGQYALVTPKSVQKDKPSWPGTYIFRASYKDRGSASQRPLEGSESLALRPAYQQAEMADSISAGVTQYNPVGSKDTTVLRDMRDGSFIVFKRTDLQGIMGVSLGIASSDINNNFSGGRIEVRMDSPTGKLLGQTKFTVKPAGKRMEISELNVPVFLDKHDGKWHDLYIVTRNENNPSSAITALDWVRFEL
jgi:cytochrome c